MYIRIKPVRSGYRVQFCHSNHVVSMESPRALRQFRSAVHNATKLSRIMGGVTIWLPDGSCR